MEEMVAPDRTIMIVSIIGLVVIWGSFFYHKFVQGGAEAHVAEAPEIEAVAGAPEIEAAAGAPEVAATGGQQRAKKKNKKKR